jgi:hypothetical protein
MMAVAIAGLATANAQLNFGVKAGLNLSNYTGIEKPEGLPSTVEWSNPYKPGFHVGAFAQYMLTKELGLEAGLYYSMLGAKQKFHIEQSGQYLTATGSTNPSYLQIPVSVLYKFDLGLGLKLYPQVGLYAGYGIAGKGTADIDTNIPNIGTALAVLGLSNEEYNYFGSNDGVETKNNRFDAGLTFGLNLQYSNFLIGLGYDLGLTKLNSEDNDSGKNVNLKLSVGYLF